MCQRFAKNYVQARLSGEFGAGNVILEKAYYVFYVRNFQIMVCSLYSRLFTDLLLEKEKE